MYIKWKYTCVTNCDFLCSSVIRPSGLNCDRFEGIQFLRLETMDESTQLIMKNNFILGKNNSNKQYCLLQIDASVFVGIFEFGSHIIKSVFDH